MMNALFLADQQLMHLALRNKVMGQVMDQAMMGQVMGQVMD